MIWEGSAVEHEGRAERIVRASESRLPEAMTDQDQPLPLARLLRSKSCVPATGWTPRSESRLGEMLAPTICSTPSAPVSVVDTASKVAMSAKL